MKNQPLRHTFSKMRTTLSFNFVVLRKKAKKSLQRIKTHVQDRTLVLFITPVVLCRCGCCRCRGFALYYKLPNNTSIQCLYHTIQFLRVFSRALLYMYREFFMNQCVIDVVIHCILCLFRKLLLFCRCITTWFGTACILCPLFSQLFLSSSNPSQFQINQYYFRCECIRTILSVVGCVF